MSTDSVVDERTLREIYLTNFEIAVKEGNPKSIMSSYNRVNGTYANENRDLLLDTLRGRWGFDGLSVWLVNFGILGLVESSGVFQSAFDKFAETTSLITEGSLFSAFLVAGIIAPFAEEFLFRGVIYRTLNRYFSITTSILVQAILFGIFHGNMVQGVYATFLGIVFGYITYKSKSLWPAVIAHMSNNILALTLPYILPSSIDSLLGYSILSILGIILTTLGLLFINKTSIKYTTSLSVD